MKIYPRKIIVRVLTTDHITLCYTPFDGWQGTNSHPINSTDLLEIIYDLLSCIVYTQCFLLKEILIYSQEGILIDTISMDTFLLEYTKELQAELTYLPLCKN
jgi:hypothetical protein